MNDDTTSSDQGALRKLFKPKTTYTEWKQRFTKEAQDGKLNRAELRRYWRQDRKLMGQRRLSFAEWRTQIFSRNGVES